MNTNIKVTSLASSSKGNAYHIKCGQTEILIDAGISATSIRNSLMDTGSSLNNISAVFITHEHTDHVKGLEGLSKLRLDLPVHITKPSADEYMRKHTYPLNIIVHDINYLCNIGDVTVRSFYSSHDSLACVGYTVEYKDDKIGIATDLGYVDKCTVNALKGCNSVILESNYDEKKLMNGTYPPDLKMRIKSPKGHLSNYDCAAFALYLAQNGTKNFLLAHLSQENNTPDIALNITSRALKDFDDVVIKVASVNAPTYLC